VKVKICGITSLDDAVMCEQMGADAIGFVHVPGRGRSMDLKDISSICHSVGPMTTKLLVCSPKDVHQAVRMCDLSGTDGVQLYGLDPSDTGRLRESGYRVIRAVGVSEEDAVRFAGTTDAVLFEKNTPGTGSEYDYSQVPVRSVPRAIIAGGLTVDNLDKAKAKAPYALDVSSGVERTIGKKDPVLVSEFIRRCRS
jgi:phosphoribosylanthranilate isomerase